MQKAVVIVAGGAGKRMGSELPKQFLPLADKPILVHTLERFLHFDPDLTLVLVLPENHIRLWTEISQEFLTEAECVRVHTCPGGESRTASVHNGLKAIQKLIPNSVNCLVAIHDGVRPFVKKKLLQSAFDLAQEKDASVVCVPVKSSMREQLAPGLSQAVDRSRFFHVQTPQTFHLAKILKAFESRPHDLFTDDASLYDDFGGTVAICEGSYDNIKITTPEDIALGESILKTNKEI